MNKLHFSRYLAKSIAFWGIIDLLLALTLSIILVAIHEEEIEMNPGLLNYYISNVYSWGFGQCFPMILVIPIILLFDYKKTYDNNTLDIIIPIAGIGAIAFLYFEVGYEIVKFWLTDFLQNMKDSIKEGESASTTIKNIFKSLIDIFKK